MSDQYEMKRTQHVSFTKEEAERLDLAREFTSQFTTNPVSVNKFVRKAAEFRAKKINEGGSNE